MVPKHVRHALLFLFSLLFLVGTVSAQRQHQQQEQQKRAGTEIRLRLAQSYERSGDPEAALKIYQEIYRQDPASLIAADGLRRLYLQLKRYDDAMEVINEAIRRAPDDISALAQLGAVYYLKSDEKRAVETWDRAIAVRPKERSTYMIVASSVMQSRLFERAIALYQRARAACNDPTLFTSDIAYLYALTLKYAEATKEYLNFMRQNPTQVLFVQTGIAAYTGRPEGLSAATRIIEETAQSEPDVLPFQYLLAWVAMEGKSFDKAYDVYRRIDEKTKAGGREIYSFAQRALHERSYAVASRAFQEVLTRYPAFERLAEVKFGYAQSLEASDDESDTLRLFGAVNPFGSGKAQPAGEDPRTLYAGAIAAYERIVTEFPNTEIAARSLLRTGIIRQEKFFDLDGSRSTFESLIKRYPMFGQVFTEGKLRLGDVYLGLGWLDKAQEAYEAIAGRGLMTSPLQEQAALRLAEALYFQGKFAGALEKLKAIIGNATSDATNDALSLQIFLQGNPKQDEPILREFAKADLLRRQRKLPEALEQLESILRNHPESDLVDETLIAIGDVQTLLARYPDAIASYGRLLKDFPESISVDRTLMKMANVYELGLKDSTKAIAAYKQLLEQYPNSIYVSEARKRIRELRGDTTI